MGQVPSEMTQTCQGNEARDRPPLRNGAAAALDDAPTGPNCGAQVQDGMHQCIATANRGSGEISESVLRNHELLQAARAGNVGAVSQALESGAWTETRRPLVMRPQAVDRNRNPESDADIGMTALMFASQAGSVDCTKRLLWANASVNAVEEDGWTPLHFASKEGSVEVCRLLLGAKGDPSMKTIDGETALDVVNADDADKITSVLNRGKRTQ